MILRNGIKRAGPAVCLFLTLLLASIPSLGETETESTESKGLLPLPDYSGDLWSRGHLTGADAEGERPTREATQNLRVGNCVSATHVLGRLVTA